MEGRLDRLLRPRSIAVIGGDAARRVVEQCRRFGFDGEIWPVHPRHEEVDGLPCFPSIGQLPNAPDAAFVGVNRHASVEVVRALAQRGAGGAVCYASGFREAVGAVGDGADLQRDLLRAAGAMPLIGPNCYGLINALDGALMWPDQHGLERREKGVAILAQSSNIALNLSMQRRGLPIAFLGTAGNQAQTDLSEMALALLHDPRITVLGLHIEGIDDIAAFETLARASRRLTKPVVTIKVGKSEQARRAAMTHTASLAGDDAAIDAFFRRLGVARLRTLPEFLETLKLLHVHGPLAGYDICSMSCSGGEAAIVADAANRHALRFRALEEDQKRVVKRTLGDIVTVDNPLDYHTFIWGDVERMTDAFAGMMAAGFDLSMVVLDFPRDDRCDDRDWMATVEATAAAAARTGAKAALVSSLAETMPDRRAAEIMALGIAPLCELDAAMAAIDAAAWIGEAWAGPLPRRLLPVQGSSGTIATLTEWESKRRLAGYGLSVPDGRLARTVEEAVDAAASLGLPVVAKGSGIAHKTEAGAVRLNLRSAEEVERAAAEILATCGELVVERMAGPACAEILVGAVRDPVAGVVLVLGSGGVLVELVGDRQVLTLPTTAEVVRGALMALKVGKMLNGYRGGGPADIDAAVDAVMALCAYIEDHVEQLEELDVNPLLVLPEGQGACAVDALISMREERT